MGNSSWGNGYHRGSEDGYKSGYSDGTKDGGLIGVLSTLGALALAKAAHWGYKTFKARRVKKHKEALLAAESLSAEAASEDDETKTIE